MLIARLRDLTTDINPGTLSSSPHHYRTRSSICQDLEQYPHLNPSKIVSFSTEGLVSIAREELFHSQRQSLTCSLIIPLREGDGLLTYALRRCL